MFYDTTVTATCLPHTGFAGVWTPATHAELNFQSVAAESIRGRKSLAQFAGGMGTGLAGERQVLQQRPFCLAVVEGVFRIPEPSDHCF